jgi:hypothetical protein
VYNPSKKWFNSLSLHDKEPPLSDHSTSSPEGSPDRLVQVNILGNRYNITKSYKYLTDIKGTEYEVLSKVREDVSTLQNLARDVVVFNRVWQIMSIWQTGNKIQ